MSASWVGVVGTIIAAMLAFVFGRVNLRRASDHERSESLRAERLATYATFCAAIVEYRRAQLHRWFVSRDLAGGVEAIHADRPEVADELRASRAAAWSAYYRLVMITDEQALSERAHEILVLTKGMKNAEDAIELNTLSDGVHEAVGRFALAARGSATTQERRGSGQQID